MRYNRLDSFEVCNGLYVGISLYLQGCPIHCKGCCNPETWDFDGGKPFTEETELTLINWLGREGISRISILGGEPLTDEKLVDLEELLKHIRFLGKTVWLYTGREFDTIYPDSKYSDILDLVDYVVAGPFIEELRDVTLKFKGSKNQEIIDMVQTRKNNRKVLMEEG